MQLDPLQPVIPTIIRGEALVFPIQLPSDQFSGDPVDISSATEIQVGFLKDDNTLLAMLLSMSQVQLDPRADLGRLNVIFQSTDTAHLKISAMPSDTNIRVEVTIAGKISIFNLDNYCTVNEKLFPAL